jgi:gas vesicle protein
VTDTLIGVIVGGLIAWVAPLMTLRYSERRWKFEAMLSAAKTEREKFEQLYEKTLQDFADGMTTNSYSSNMMSDILILMPKEIGDIFNAHMEDLDRSETRMKHTYFDLAAAMKRDLKARDGELRRLLEK